MNAFARFLNTRDSPPQSPQSHHGGNSGGSGGGFQHFKIQHSPAEEAPYTHPTVADFLSMVAAGGWQDDPEERAAIQEYDGGLQVDSPVK